MDVYDIYTGSSFVKNTHILFVYNNCATVPHAVDFTGYMLICLTTITKGIDTTKIHLIRFDQNNQQQYMYTL